MDKMGTTLPNADSFNDLCDEDKAQLLKYIKESFKKTKTINRKQSAYGLKSRFNRLTGPNKKHHITSQCFMEAMVEAGFDAIPVPRSGKSNWYFNIGITHFTD